MRRACGWAAKALVLLAALVALGLAGRHEYPALAAAGGLVHAACYCFLLWTFGRSLAPGREPLVTRLARRVHGAMPAAMEAFTRRVTIAWCAFFAGQLGASALLLTAGPLQAWALFVTVLNLPLLALMFIGQFVYRRARHPEFPRASPWQALQAYARESPLSNRAEMR
jgi:uncharacterized membrane protein